MNASSTWPLFANDLYHGLIPECSSSWRSARATSRRRTYCFWARQPLVNVTRECPQNRRCGRSVRTWQPPGLREFGRAETAQCLRGKKWILFVGDSQTRTLFNLLLTHVTGRSQWPSLANATTDTLWNSLAWPASDRLGLCSGGSSDEDASATYLKWNVSSAPIAFSSWRNGRVDSDLGSSSSSSSSDGGGPSSSACTRDYMLPDTGTRLSFIFVGRLHQQWGQLCDLAHHYYYSHTSAHGNANANADANADAATPAVHSPPDAIILSHSAWPMVKAPPNGAACDATRYARDLRALLRLLTLGRKPSASVLDSTATGIRGQHATCASSGRVRGAKQERATSQQRVPMHAHVPDIYWMGQPRSQAPAAQRCLASGAWTAAQQWALSPPISPSGDSSSRGGSPSGSRGSSGAGLIRYLDSWFLVDEAARCLTTRECAAQPSPRMRDHVHYHWPAYLAIMQNLLNQLCG